MVVLSATARGRRRRSAAVKRAFAQPWQKLAVRLNGADVSVTFGEKPLFEAKDPKPAAGRAGLAAQGPGEASFDEFILDFAPAEPAK